MEQATKSTGDIAAFRGEQTFAYRTTGKRKPIKYRVCWKSVDDLNPERVCVYKHDFEVEEDAMTFALSMLRQKLTVKVEEVSP